MRSHRGSILAALAALTLVAGLLVTIPAKSASAAVDSDTLTAALSGDNIPYPGGDTGGSGTFSLALDAAQTTACFVIDVTLTDLVGDPPTGVTVVDSYTDELLLSLASSVDATGHASACVAASVSVIDALFAKPDRYNVDVQTTNFAVALRGWLSYSYEVDELEVFTRVCPASIQSVGQLTSETKASCLVVVLPPDDVLPFVPDGYTTTGYGGTATFDYHVTDGRHLDTTIASASRGGGGTCSDLTKSCDFAWLPYVWDAAAMDEIHVMPVTLPAGTRFGAAEAAEITELGGSLPLSVGVGNDLTVTAAGARGVAVTVYAFRSADTTAPTVSSPTVSIRTGVTLGSRIAVRLAWTASDSGSGIGHFTVQRSVDGASWSTLASSLTGTSYSTSMASGHRYRYRVRAYDKAGNSTLSAASVSQQFRLVQDTRTAIHYGGTWHLSFSSAASGGTVHRATARGATASLTFTGRSIAWVAPTGLTRGSAKVYVDGSYAATISLHGPAAARQIVFAKRFAGAKSHTIRIRVSATSGHPRVDLDGFVYLN